MHQVQKFDISKVAHGRSFLLLGSRNTGKSVLLEDLLYHRRKNIDFIAAQTSTTSTKEMLCQHIPPSLVTGDGFDQNLLQMFIDQIKENTEKHKDRNSVWVGDDLAFDPAFMKSIQIKYLSMNGRHNNTEIFVTCQYLLNIVPAIRSTADIVMALAEPIRNNQRKLFEYFFGVFPTFAMFQKTFEQVTANYGVLVLDRTQRSGKLEDMIRFYRASPKLPEFKLGKRVYWVLNDMHIAEAKKKTVNKNAITIV